MPARPGVRVKLAGRAPHAGAIAGDGPLLDGLRVQERIPIAANTSIAEGVRDAGVVLFLREDGEQRIRRRIVAFEGMIPCGMRT